MTPIADLAEAKRALRRYLVAADGTLPTATYDQLEKLVDSPSIVDAIARSAELLYARRDQLDDAGRTIVGQTAAFAAVNGWHGMADGNRGGLILQAMERDIAAGRVDPDEADPAPASEYVEAAALAPLTPAAG